ncbi:MAG: FtsQ-type POTRA domain-containing protein [Victivallaceae bacterium]|nr:FtsQ-type POTRA domain-containing protein [Victivallaceae bacterium]
MAKKKNSKKNSKAVNSKEKQKFLRVILVFLIICFSLVAIAFACRGVFRVLFTKNERLILRRVKLVGMESRRSNALIKYLKLNLYNDNLFDIDIAKIRRKIEKISYIKSARVYRVLPDTLKIVITQRVPIAYLFRYGAKWVVDEDAVVMNKKYCMKLKYSLPVITGFRYKKLRSGEKIPNLTQAINLLKLTTSEFRKFKISSISLENTRKITFVMIKKRRAYKVLMPKNDINDMLQVLRYALQQKQGKHKSTIDLTYENQVIFR